MRARRIRVLRGLIAAATATLVAALSHTLSGESAPGVFALAAASVLAVFVCILFAGRSLSPLRLGASVVLSQLGYHLLFALAPATSGTVTTGGHHSGMVLLTTDAATHVHASAGPAMWFGHAVAAVVTIGALLHGERVLLALVDTLRLGIRALLVGRAPSIIGRPSLTGVDWLPVFVASQRLLLSVMRHRGPPLAARRNALAIA